MTDEHDLHWHAFNYRTASTIDANEMFNELVAWVDRRVAAERERCANVCLAEAVEECCGEDEAYNMAVGHCAAAIRGLKS